jgi:hypothetical protein
MSFGFTWFTKSGGPLTKAIELIGDKLISDAAACAMASGTAERWLCDDIGQLAEDITSFKPNHALSLGSLRRGLPDQVEIVTKSKLNGDASVIARTAENLIFRPGKPALTLLDYDTKSMPAEIAERVADLGGFEAALLTLLPDLAKAARLMRASTSAGLYHGDTGEKLRGSNGKHLMALLADGADNPRFLQTLHERCWLAGFGWFMVGKAGQLLDRSIIDRVVGTPERLIFEGPPILIPPLRQDAEARACRK